MNDIEDIVKKVINEDNNNIIINEFKEIKSIKEFNKKFFEVRKKYKIQLSKRILYNYYQKSNINNEILKQCLMKFPSRSQHGVIVISVIMGPHKFSCSHNCSYCPSYPQYAKSYIPEEPTVLRGERNDFKSDLQLKERVNTLINNAHNVDKLEVIILGGTFSNYPHDYSENFIKYLYYGANTVFDNQDSLRPILSLKEERTINENSKCKIIGLTLETRPDYIKFYELVRFRSYGCTRVQLGVQSTNEYVLEKNNRNCNNNDTKKAIKLLLDNCFKVDIHIMPDLPYSDYTSDLYTFHDILFNSKYYADQYKIYPTMITEYTEIKKWYDKDIYKPRYESKQGIQDLIDLCIYFKSNIKRNKRINRLIRDFSNKFIEGGTKTTHLRQVIQKQMKEKGLKCKCIRCREVKNNVKKSDIVRLRILHEKACDGDEYFLSYENCNCKLFGYKFCYKYFLYSIFYSFLLIIITFIEIFIPFLNTNFLNKYIYWSGCNNEDKCYGFLRLRFPSNQSRIFNELFNCSLLRELHIYGNVANTIHYNNKQKNYAQHQGYGQKLVNNAIQLSKSYGFHKIAVISGDGVKNYYREKFNFIDDGHYLIKKI